MYSLSKWALTAAVASLALGCSSDRLEEKGFRVDNAGIEQRDSLGLSVTKDAASSFATRPGGVLLTGIPNVRLTTVYKVNWSKDGKSTFTGSDDFHYSYRDEDDRENNWNYNLMPGLAAVYGYNLVNVSHYDIQENKQKEFFEKPVLIRTVYYPSFSKDTLNGKPADRNFFMVSVYNEDTNGDGSIDLKDLRRFYLFDVNGVRQKALLPENYTVLGSDYDQANDLMFVFAKLDENGNGRADESEPIHIHWIDLKDPQRTGRLY